jgi:DNA-binding CsgD family transcriptional regulator
VTRLPKRQAQIAYLTITGWREAEIAAKLGIKPKAVSSTRREIYKKFNVSTAVGLVHKMCNVSVGDKRLEFRSDVASRE